MRAAIYKGIENMIVEEVDYPILPEDGIIVKIMACGICGSDLRTYYSGTSYVTPPAIIGHEIAGVVVEIGQSADIPYILGDRVAIAPPIHCGRCFYCQRGKQNLCLNVISVSSDLPGGFAEYIALSGYAVKNGCVNKIPDNLDFATAGISELACSVIKCQEDINVGPTDTVVVIGAGPVGCLHVQLSKLRGANYVIQSDLNNNRLNLAEKFGANLLVNNKEENLDKIVMEVTNCRGAEVVIVAAPSVEACNSALALVAKGGRMVVFAGMPKDDPMLSLDGNVIHYRDIQIYGTTGFAKRHQELALKLASEGRLNISELITKRIPLEQIVDGIESMKTGKELKVVVEPFMKGV